MEQGVHTGDAGTQDSAHTQSQRYKTKLQSSRELLQGWQLQKIDYDQIRKIFLEPEVAKVDEIIFEQVDYDGISNYLVKERSFSEDRIQSSLNRLRKAIEKKSQNLDQWF